ncbi:hypothetical protein ACW2QC_07790 [Virgibacillus sp. FSP13]
MTDGILLVEVDEVLKPNYWYITKKDAIFKWFKMFIFHDLLTGNKT